MEQPTFSHQDDQGYPTEQRESHWLPALRPEADPSDEIHPPEETILLEPTPSHNTLVGNNSDTESPANFPSVAKKATTFEPDDNDDDERVDSAWGFKRVDSAHFLDGAQRSTSFPMFQSTSSPDGTNVLTVNGVDSPTNDVDFNDLLNDAPTATISALEERDNEGQASEPEVLDQAPGFDMNEPQADLYDQRYEEGIPLISHTEPLQPSDSVVQDSSRSNAFASTGGEDEDSSFFSQIQDPSNGDSVQPTLERKSTEDVLESLDTALREHAQEPTEFLGFQSDTINHSFNLPPVTEAETEDNVQVIGKEVDSRWAAVLDDDDDEFLVEDADDLLPDSEPTSPSSFTAALHDDSSRSINEPGETTEFMELLQSKTSTAQIPSNPYAPQQSSTSDMTQLSPKAHGNVGLGRPNLAPMGSFQNHIQQPQIVQRAESFADQAKGGYKSPYDLPMELSKPKKRPQTQRITSQQQGVPPPPRSSSISSQKQLQSPFSPTAPGFGLTEAAVVSPPIGNRVPSAPASTGASAKRSNSSSFFVELPMIPRTRPSPAPARYTPSQSDTAPLPPLPPASPPVQRQPLTQPTASPPRISDPYAQFQLQPPERLDPYANVSAQAPSLPVPTVPTNRYSPAPGTVPGAPKPAPSPRYSPAPPSQPPAGPGRYASQPGSVPAQTTTNRYASQAQAPPSTNAAQLYLPRTSSPLAYQGRSITEQANSLMPPPPLPKATQTSQTGCLVQSPPRTSTPPVISPPPAPSASLAFSPPKASDTPIFAPPRRSQTQSPSRQMPRSAVPAVLDSSNIRPASAYSQVPVTKGFTQIEQTTPVKAVGRVRAAIPEFDFEQPQDDTQHDPLQRWRGAPIFRFGFGGVVVSSFPKHTPRYKAGQLKPTIKSTAGEVRTRTSKDLSLLPEHVTSFPGPLRGKSKKKDLLSWMTSTITRLENNKPTLLGPAQTLPDPCKCHDEMILLWKIVKTVVEHDGVVDNKPEALKALNIILSPEVHAIDESTASQYRADTELTGIYHPAGGSVRAESTDPLAVENLRKHLLKGEREQAVWKAADSRLWSHALLIASTFKDDHKLWRQVVQEFVRQEVKPIGSNSESLSALYEIFGGNMEESIDQIVPPSARAGLQMVSRIDTNGPIKNALDGLDRWKETLSLVLNNRTPEDQRALATLGNLLANYGRIQAAHICYLFARNPLLTTMFGGIDDPQASITLLGSDQRARPFSFHLDADAVLLTEAYEFAISTLPPTPIALSLPHLSAYKYERALELADNGFKVEAQAYCDAIAAGLTSKTKMSPYYHASLLVEVDELTKRLKQVPVQSTSWIAKPSVEKATSSLLSKLSNFVAGDDSDAESKGSGAEVGPFAKTSGSPVISRSGSQTDLYGSYPAMTPVVAMTAAGSRYAPGGAASTRSSSELTRGRASLELQRSPPASSHAYEPRQSVYGQPSSVNQFSQSPARSVSSYQPYSTSPSRSNYQATPPQSSYMPDFTTTEPSATSKDLLSEPYTPVATLSEQQSSYMPVQPEREIPPQFEQPSYGGYASGIQSPPRNAEPVPEQQEPVGYEQPQSYGYGYEPPADSGYVPYQPEPDSDEDGSKKQKPKKKSFMDDGAGYSLTSKGATGSKPVHGDATAEATRKKANDEVADAAFRAAAEADAQRAKDDAAQKKAAGGGWLGGWFGGKKVDNSLDAAPKSSGGEPKVFKAKLGENKMKLYYDKDLRKWVNPDDPDSMKAKSTPPPPPPGRSPAPPAAGGPPMMGGTPVPPMINSQASTPASTAGGEPAGPGINATLPPSVSVGLGLPSSSGTPPPGMSGGSPPVPAASGGLALPSRPASSIDDLIGPAGPRKGGRAAKGSKKGRYVDVMAQ